MQYGHFDDALREYVIDTPTTPLPWINYLGSEDFFALVSNTAGGYCFYKDARLRRITRYRYNGSPLDADGFHVYVRMADGTVWNPGWQPTQQALDFYRCRHGLGYTVIQGKKDGISLEQAMLVPNGDNCLLLKLTVRNESAETQKVSLFPYVEFCLWDAMDDSSNFQRNFSTGEVEIEKNALYHKTEYRERRDHYAYYAVNRDLTLAVAEKAKADGVGQFLYMSSAIVYGDSAPIGKRKVITKDTPAAPANFYGDSKAQAEKGLKKLESDAFRVAVLRPPMIYGPGSKGNYPTLSKMARKLPLFPKVDNQRSMLYVENLAECVRLLIEQGIGGIFWPQNREYSNTSQLVALIAKAHGKHLVLVPGFTWALKLLSHCTGLVNKAFGSLCYDPALSAAPGDYCVADLARSIEETEKTL
mgnify:CR=1 FL=1